MKGARLKKKIKKPDNKPEKLKYVCHWCNKQQTEDKFFKCSLDNHANICKSCIKKKYDNLLSVCGKEKTLFICCHYLNLSYFSEIANEFDVSQGLGHYIRLLNLKQLRHPEDFEKGILKGYSDSFAPIDNTAKEIIKKRLTEIISELEKARDEI